MVAISWKSSANMKCTLFLYDFSDSQDRCKSRESARIRAKLASTHVPRLAALIVAGTKSLAKQPKEGRVCLGLIMVGRHSSRRETEWLLT